MPEYKVTVNPKNGKTYTHYFSNSPVRHSAFEGDLQRVYPEQEPQPGNKDRWFYYQGHLRFPTLFTNGYRKFKNIIFMHNRKWPKDLWPEWDFKRWQEAAIEIKKQDLKDKQRQTRKEIRDRLNETRKRRRMMFFNYMTSKYGAWPSYSNWYYRPLPYNHDNDYVSTEQIHEDKRNFWNSKFKVAAQRAAFRYHLKHKN